MTSPEPAPVSAAEIAELLSWTRRLTQTGRHDDPTERAAYLAAKADLLARITDHTATPPPDSTKDSR